MYRTLVSTCLAAALLATQADAQNPGGVAPAAQAPPAGPDQAQDAAPGLVTLNVQAQPLGQVLELISVSQHVNIVAGVDTNVPVTANFYDATLEQALDWVLGPLGYAWTFDGKVYQVMPAASYDLIRRPLVNHVFRPNYLSVAELEKFLTQFLSPQGRLVVSEPPKSGIPSSADETGGLSSALPETLVVIDNQQAIDKMIEMTKDLDRRPRQVLVEATILEVRLDETNKFGVDFNVLLGSQMDDFESLAAQGQVYSTTPNFVPGGFGPAGTAAGAPFLTPENTASAAQSGFTDNGDGLRLGWVGSNVTAFLEALQSTTDTNVLANTKVLALNKQRGEIIIGGRLGYFGGTTVSQGVSQQTVEFLEVGTQLRFRPFISNDGFVRLEIHPQRSSGIVDQATGLPTEQTSEVTSNIMVRDGETVVIGGLIETKDINTTKRVPVLGYLPGVGWLFSSEETTTQRNEIIVLLTPHILEDGEPGESGEHYVKDSQDDTVQMRKNAGPVARVEYARRTLDDAREAMDRGDLDDARVLCDRSLLLDPLADGALELSREIDTRLTESVGAPAPDGG
jgi:type IV pilus assembly protein PilQ